MRLVELSSCQWSGGGSNSRPLHCERSALPTELPPQFVLSVYLVKPFRLPHGSSPSRLLKKGTGTSHSPPFRGLCIAALGASPLYQQAAGAERCPTVSNLTPRIRPLQPQAGLTEERDPELALVDARSGRANLAAVARDLAFLVRVCRRLQPRRRERHPRSQRQDGELWGEQSVADGRCIRQPGCLLQRTCR